MSAPSCTLSAAPVVSSAQCAHCINRRIADAVEVWAQTSLPADRNTMWSVISDLLNTRNLPPPEVIPS